MSNLFSIFDPTNTMMIKPCLNIMILILFLFVESWHKTSSNLKIKQKIFQDMKKEINFSAKKSKSQEIFLLTVLIILMLMNLTALYPQVFSLTSHLWITFPLSMMMWLSVNFLGWLKMTKKMLSHLVPQSTPSYLMPFMVMIEMTSNLIRPITLCVRLTANMIAGHLLMSLLANVLMEKGKFTMAVFSITPMILTVLESAVAFIQSYVFFTLVTLYITEVKK